MEGLFTGYIRFLDTKREPVSVSWELRPDYSHNPVEGQFNLKLSGGETNSETSGTGEFSNISALADDRGGFIVESCGGKCYLQLYSTTAEQLVGNYYEAKSAKNFDRVGYIEMRK